MMIVMSNDVIYDNDVINSYDIEDDDDGEDNDDDFSPTQLLATADDVAKMQEELETMQPMLEEATQETLVTMEKIKEDTVSLHLVSYPVLLLSVFDEFFQS